MFAQKITNVSNRQEQSTIIVSYDLETKTPCKISLFVSTNGGTTWQGPLKKVSGDVGANVNSGNKNITWNVLEEFEELRGKNIKFKVTAYAELLLESIKIGDQEWMKKNLELTTYRNGDIIPEVKDPIKWAALTTGAWCYYNNDPENGKTYGKLYNWYAVNDPRGLAPKGYHVPTDAEWTKLIAYLGGEKIAGGKLKDTGALHWVSPNTGASNIIGFSGLPAGCHNDFDTFYGIGQIGYWWSSSEDDNTYAWYRTLYYNDGNANRNSNVKYYGFSVRCVKD
jgi:uncharacterized protein (TIGR02145 family)